MNANSRSSSPHVILRYCLLCLCLLFTSFKPAVSETYRIGNRYLERIFESNGAEFVTTSFKNNMTGQELPVQSCEFVLEIAGQGVFTAFDCEVKQLERTSDVPGQSGLDVVYRLKELQLEITVAYTIRDADFFMRKRLTVRSRGSSSVVLRRVEAERLLVIKRTGSIPAVEKAHVPSPSHDDIARKVLGQPVFLPQNLFFGMEFPGSYTTLLNGVLTAMIHPGQSVGTDGWECDPVVIGAAPKGELAEWFYRYIDTVRIPPRTLLMYEPWFDFRWGEYSEDIYYRRIALYERYLKKPFGITLDSYVLSAGGEDPYAFWAPEPTFFPNGYEPVSNFLRERGSGLGLWFSLEAFEPWLYIEDMVAKGWELSNVNELKKVRRLDSMFPSPDTKRFFCLSAPNYNRALRDQLRYFINDVGINYMKHDFNFIPCAAEDHGHLAEFLYGFEANVRAMIDILQFQKSLDQKIFLNITSRMWPSPWWLPYADTVWRTYGDSGWLRESASPRPRDWAMNYMDAALHNNNIRDELRFPISAYMAHGLIKGKYNEMGGEKEPLSGWADYVVNFFAHGFALQELYLTPDLLSGPMWEVLGGTIRWTEAHKDLLFDMRMLSANPRAGEVYGFTAWSDTEGIANLRNPNAGTGTITLQIPGRVSEPLQAEIVYPYRMSLPGDWRGGQSFAMSLEQFEVLIIHFHSPSQRLYEVPVAVRYGVNSTEKRIEKVLDADERTMNAWKKRVRWDSRKPSEYLIEGDAEMFAPGEVEMIVVIRGSGSRRLPGTGVRINGRPFGIGVMMDQGGDRNSRNFRVYRIPIRLPRTALTFSEGLFANARDAEGNAQYAVEVWLHRWKNLETTPVPHSGNLNDMISTLLPTPEFNVIHWYENLYRSDAGE